MKRQELVKLSKLMSVALRHNPADFELTLDVNGWVTLADLVHAIAARPRWQWIKTEHVLEVVNSSDKRRFEVEGAFIRARYGHSRAARPVYQPVTPPEILYHGTPRRNIPAIRQRGLQPMSRQYVHLSATPEMAIQVGQRRDERPAILLVRAVDAHTSGIKFGTPSGQPDDVYLVGAIPPHFIEFPEEVSSPSAENPASDSTSL
jgi:putative RNA 2'-phosphotransferase